MKLRQKEMSVLGLVFLPIVVTYKLFMMLMKPLIMVCDSVFPQQMAQIREAKSKLSETILPFMHILTKVLIR